jgi:hypothetical protein
MLAEFPDANVQAVIKKTRQEPKVEDWTHRSYIYYCRDLPDQDARVQVRDVVDGCSRSVGGGRIALGSWTSLVHAPRRIRESDAPTGLAEKQIARLFKIDGLLYLIASDSPSRTRRLLSNPGVPRVPCQTPATPHRRGSMRAVDNIRCTPCRRCGDPVEISVAQERILRSEKRDSQAEKPQRDPN